MTRGRLAHSADLCILHIRSEFKHTYGKTRVKCSGVLEPKACSMVRGHASGRTCEQQQNHVKCKLIKERLTID